MRPQSKIVDAIKDIKETRSARTKSEITTDLIEAARSLIDQKAGRCPGHYCRLHGDTAGPWPGTSTGALFRLINDSGPRSAIRRAGRIPVDLNGK